MTIQHDITDILEKKINSLVLLTKTMIVSAVFLVQKLALPLIFILSPKSHFPPLLLSVMTLSTTKTKKTSSFENIVKFSLLTATCTCKTQYVILADKNREDRQLIFPPNSTIPE